MMPNNEKQINNSNRVINDYDGVSLYPSSMSLMDGYVKGMPKYIDMNTFKLDDLKIWDYYFIKVKVSEVGVKRAMPLFSKNIKCVKNWTNDVLYKEGDENSYYYFDRYQLEDAIEFHKIKFEVVEGFYFNEGFNTSIKTEIKKVFDLRLKAKKEGNPGLSNLLKLLMNSSYGKLGQRAAETNTVIKPSYQKDRYIINHYHEIISWEENKNSKFVKFEIKIPIVKSYSMPHLSCQILSYSKRIMNQVICLAEDNNIKIFYQDTDSMHMYDDEVSKLENCYRVKYNKELTGKNLGQFHCDFEPHKDYENAVSVKFIGLGKKCYIDQLTAYHKKTKEAKTFYHIRMKGVSTNAILSKAIEYNCTPIDIYQQLYDGKSIVFDLGVDNKSRFKKSCGEYYMANSITRTLSF